MSDEPVAAPATGAAPPGAGVARCLDVAVASLTCLLLSPLLLLIAVAIWIEGGRPLLFSQLRLGRNGVPFRMHKFRKFSAHCGPGCPLTIANDARLTCIGRVLAATKLDELPQLWNVLRDEMALVGPRPESMAFAECFRNGFEQVLDHKPGLVGPSQIMFRNECNLYPSGADPADYYREHLFPAKARLDIAYFSNRRLSSDIVWIIYGVFAVFGYSPRDVLVNARKIDQRVY